MRTVDELMIEIDDLAASRKRASTDRQPTASTPSSVPPDTPLVVDRVSDATPFFPRSETPAEHAPTAAAQTPEPAELPKAPQQSPPAAPNSVPRSVGDFNMADDAEFINEAYRYLLNREPDDAARSYYDRLQRGYVSRVEVLHAIARTPEAKKREVRIRGLKLRYLLIAPFRVRFFGYGLRIVTGLIRLPRHVRTIYTNNRDLSKIATELGRSQHRINELEARLEAASTAISEANNFSRIAVARLDRGADGLHHRLSVFIQHVTSKIGQFGIAIDRDAEKRGMMRFDLQQLREVFDQNARALEGLRNRVDGLPDILARNSQSIVAVSEKVDDLNSRFIGRLDELGHLGASFSTLDSQVVRLSETAAAAGERINEINGRLDELGHLGASFSTLDSRVVGLSETAATASERINEINGRLDDLGRLDSSISGLNSRLDGLERRRSALDIELAITEFRRRLHALERSSNRPADSGRAKPSARSKDKDVRTTFPIGNQAFDSFYADFESRFRGTREDIKGRQSVYLPYLKTDDQALAQMPIYDIGCGRGEWLELLGKHGIAAVGVEINKCFLDDDERHGLTVIHGDGLTFLKSQPDNSARAITGFHIIEHLEFSTVIELLDESLRVLAPGGLAIFETPNPENLLTAAHYFYLDPTHRNPIPPALAAYLLNHRGFSDVEVLRLQSDQIPNDADFNSKFLNHLFFGPRDYGVIGRK